MQIYCCFVAIMMQKSFQQICYMQIQELSNCYLISKNSFVSWYVSSSSSWQILHQLQRDEHSGTGGDGIILQKRRLVHRTSAGAECRTTFAGVLDKRGSTSSGSSRQRHNSLHCSMYCSGVPALPAEILCICFSKSCNLLKIAGDILYSRNSIQNCASQK